MERALEAWLAEPPDTGRRAPRATHRWLSGWRAAVAIVGSIALAAAVAGVVWHLASHTRADAPQATAGVAQAPLPFNAGDWVVVADIENRTGEDVLDGAIEAAVKRELEFSDHVRVAQRGRVEDALRSLSRPVTARLDRQLARDVSLRDSGVRALIAGSVTKAEGAYVMALDIVNPADGATISSLTDRAAQRSDILAAVRRQTLRVRAALGEPVASIDHSRQVLERSPLPTLTAFSLYARARMIMAVKQPSGAGTAIDRLLTAERMLQDAIKDDPTFARLHLQLSMANVGLTLQKHGDHREAIVRHSERAFQLAATATPQERYRIIATTHHHRAGDRLPPGVEDPVELEQAASAFEAVFALQPDDDDVMVLLQNCYRTLGRARDAAWMDLRLADARPLNVDVNFRVATRLLREGNFDGARRYALRAQTALSPKAAAVQPQQALSIRLFPALAAWLQDDARETLRSIDQFAGTADHSSSSDWREVGLSLWPIYVALGRIDQARQLLDATRLIEGSGVEKQRVEVSRASFFDVIGDRRALHEVVATWPDAFPEDAQGGGELASLIETGKFEAAERELQRWDRFSRNFGRPGEVIHLNFAGAIELARGHHAAAIDLLQNSMGTMRLAPADRGWSLSGQGQWAAPKLAEALEKAHRLPEAIAILEEAGARRSEVAVGPSYGIALWMRHRSQLARLYRKNGQTREAEAVEAHLLKLLAVADPDYPLLLELRARR